MVIVVDTSAWVELFKRGGHPVAETLKALLDRRADLAITEVVLMEVLAGAPSGPALIQVRSRLIGLPVLRLEGIADFEEAAQIYRTCRDAGQTVRSQLDCLIAVPTIRHGATLLHRDRDFETIARHTALKLEPLGGPTVPERRELREHKGRFGTTSARARGTRRRKARPATRGASRSNSSR